MLDHHWINGQIPFAAGRSRMYPRSDSTPFPFNYLKIWYSGQEVGLRGVESLGSWLAVWLRIRDGPSMYVLRKWPQGVPLLAWSCQEEEPTDRIQMTSLPSSLSAGRTYQPAFYCPCSSRNLIANGKAFWCL